MLSFFTINPVFSTVNQVLCDLEKFEFKILKCFMIPTLFLQDF